MQLFAEEPDRTVDVTFEQDVAESLGALAN